MWITKDNSGYDLWLFRPAFCKTQSLYFPPKRYWFVPRHLTKKIALAFGFMPDGKSIQSVWLVSDNEASK
jgi:hypothetical protein